MVLRRVRLVLLVVTLVVLENTVFRHLRIFGAIPSLCLVATVAIAYEEGPQTGALFGFLSGLATDMLLSGTPAGLSALSFALTGFAMGVLQGGLVREVRGVAPLLAAAGGLLGGTIFLVVGGIAGVDGFFTLTSVRIVIVASLYDALVAVPVFKFTHWANHDPERARGVGDALMGAPPRPPAGEPPGPPRRPRPPGPPTRAEVEEARRLMHRTYMTRRAFVGAGVVAIIGGIAAAAGAFSGGGGKKPSVRSIPGVTTTPTQPDHTFETVIRGGRVIDPASGYDQVGDVGIDGGTVLAISKTALTGTNTIDATGLVVSPGWIDILSYEPNTYGIWYKVADGVTTNLGLHGLEARATDYFATWGSEENRPPTNYGGAFSDKWTRGVALGMSVDAPATTAQIDQLVAMCDEDLNNGYIAVDFEPEYTPGIAFDEIKALAEVAKQHDVPCTFHGRYSDDVPPGTNAETLAEILRVAEETGARVHVEHIISTGGTFTMAESIKTLEDARAKGLEVTACTYPYDFWATYLLSPRFNSGWQERFHITYDDLVIVGTGERLTESSFNAYQASQKNLLTAAYAIPESDVRMALQTEWILLGSDAILEPGNHNHPRSTGCFARAIGRYTRELGVIDLKSALAKATILPARLTERGAPAMRKKGRLQIGADADITVFDPATLVDRSTVENPGVESEGVRYVLVAGQVVRDGSGNRHETRPGAPILKG